MGIVSPLICALAPPPDKFAMFAAALHAPASGV